VHSWERKNDTVVLGVKIIFHAFNNAGNESSSSLDELMYAQQLTRAADYGFWIVASNDSTAHSRMGSGLFSPDGSNRLLNRNESGIIYSEVPGNNLGWTYFQEHRPKNS